MSKFGERMIPEEEINKTAPESGDLNLRDLETAKENRLQEKNNDDTKTSSEKYSNRFIRDFLNKKTLKEKTDALHDAIKAAAIDDEFINWVSNISSDDLENMDQELYNSKDLEIEKKINYQDSVDYFINEGDYDTCPTNQIVYILAGIIGDSKIGKSNPKAEIALLNLLKNWNIYETHYFYKESNSDYPSKKDGQKKQTEFKKMEEDLIDEEDYLASGSHDQLREYIDGAINHEFITTKRKIIKSLGETGSRKSIDSLIDMIIKGRRSAHNIDLIGAFKKIDKPYAEQKLLPLLINKDEIIRTNSIAVIFGLNFYKGEIMEHLGSPDLQKKAEEILKGAPHSMEDVRMIQNLLYEAKEKISLLKNEYGAMIDSINQEVDQVHELCKEIFFQKQLDEDQIVLTAVKTANHLLSETAEKIKKAGDSDKMTIIKRLINELKKQRMAREKTLNELKKIAAELNRRYGEIYKKYDDITHEQFKNEIREKEFGSKDVPPEEIDEYMDYIDAMREMEYHPAVAESVDEAEKAIQEKEKIDNNFDSNRIEDILKEMEHYLSGWANRNGEISDFRNELKNLLKFQKNFERKLEQIVYGEESASLPKEFTESLPWEIAEIKPENLPINAPLYMPVGISKELPEWKKVFEYDKKAAKPIDLYGYLFWLENQDRPAELVVCDEIQAANYALLYPNDQRENSSSDFRDLARKIGEQEKENYQKIIDAFGLKNIKIIDYREFVKRNEGKFEKYRGLCERLAKNPIFAGGFLSMIQESVSQSMAREEKEKFLPYAVEEVGWILATEGSKVSHINEARYDVLAAVIKNIEKYAADHNIDIFDPRNEEKLPSIINGVLNKLKDRFSAVKSASRNDPDIFEYYEKAEQVLKKIRLTAGAGIPADFSKKYADYPFAVPRTGSQSFGWRSGGEKQEAVIKFREPYSTYFYKNGSELFLESDQVVAAEGLIAGKILTMPAEVQQEYAERTIKPILIHYFKALENAPKEYFKKAGKSHEELLSECQESQTLIDLLKFIQKYIVKSSS